MRFHNRQYTRTNEASDATPLPLERSSPTFDFHGKFYCFSAPIFLSPATARATRHSLLANEEPTLLSQLILSNRLLEHFDVAQLIAIEESSSYE